MWSKALTLLSWAWGKKTWLVAGLAAALLASFAWAYVQGLRLDAVRAESLRQIHAEQVAHNSTRAELAAALAEAARWADVATLARAATTSMRATAQAALDREVQAQVDSRARKQILSVAKPRIRTDVETVEVVDNATRHRAADRLNRPW
jgi:hypothetical protein